MERIGSKNRVIYVPLSRGCARYYISIYLYIHQVFCNEMGIIKGMKLTRLKEKLD